MRLSAIVKLVEDNVLAGAKIVEADYSAAIKAIKANHVRKEEAKKE